MNEIRKDHAPGWLADGPPAPAPDICLTLPASGGDVLARAALWWRSSPEDPEVPGNRLGCIGRFACGNAEAGRLLVEAACAELKAAGCRRAVGPMDGDTWHPYRLVTGGRERSPRFFLEPWNDPREVEAFESAGFRPLARYSSSELSLDETFSAEGARQDRLAARLRERGIEVRPISLESFESELASLHRLCLAAFEENFLYTPLDLDGFLALYTPVKSLVSPEFVLVAERAEEPLGFVFALPDVLHPDLRRLVVKTLAVHPRHRHLGLGTVLVEAVQRRARAAGFALAIHALQYEGNSSLKITRRQAGRPIREYTLFQRHLAPPP